MAADTSDGNADAMDRLERVAQLRATLLPRWGPTLEDHSMAHYKESSQRTARQTNSYRIAYRTFAYRATENRSPIAAFEKLVRFEFRASSNSNIIN